VSFLLGVLAVQAVVGLAVVYALARVLDRMLADLALRTLEAGGPVLPPGSQGEVSIVSRRPLPKAMEERARRAVAKRISPEAGVRFQIDRRIWGGAVVRAGDQVLDFSLKDRVTKALSTR